MHRLLKYQFKMCSWQDDLHCSQVPILWHEFPGAHALNARACGVQKFQGDPKIVYCRALQEKGTNVVCVDDGLPTWVAEVGTLALHHDCLADTDYYAQRS